MIAVPIDEESEKIVEVEDEDLQVGSKKKKEAEQQEEWISDDKSLFL